MGGFIEDLFTIIKRLENSNMEHFKEFSNVLKESCEIALENTKLIHENIKLKTQLDMHRAELVELRKLNDKSLSKDLLEFIRLNEEFDLSDTESIDISI